MEGLGSTLLPWLCCELTLFSPEQHASPCRCIFLDGLRFVRLSLSAKSAVIQQYFSLTTNQQTVLSATVNQRTEHAGRMGG
jgi:hypothetical protein